VQSCSRAAQPNPDTDHLRLGPGQRSPKAPHPARVPSNPVTDASDKVRALLRTRQTREFTDEPVGEADLNALADVARWSGSSANTQPWRFIVIREEATLRKIADAGMPQTRSLRSAMAAIAIAMPEEQGKAVSHAYDEGRAAERILVGATMLGLGPA
jgi:nitroreductase